LQKPGKKLFLFSKKNFFSLSLSPSTVFVFYDLIHTPPLKVIVLLILPNAIFFAYQLNF